MAKIVYNACYGGFNLSDKAIVRYAELKGITLYPEMHERYSSYYLVPVEKFKEVEEICRKMGDHAAAYDLCFEPRRIERNDPILAQVVEELGKEVNGYGSELRIRELETGTKYHIDEYDGAEFVIAHDEMNWSLA